MYSDFKVIQAKLNLGEDSDVWKANWDSSQRAWKKEIFFLQDEYIEQTCSVLGFSDEIREAFLGARHFYCVNEAMSRLAWHCHYLMFVHEGGGADMSNWPMLPAGLGEAADMFYAFVFLSGVPFLSSLHKKYNVSEAITVDTFKDLELCMYDYRVKTGRWGLSEYKWLQLHFQGKIYRLGRLQFEISHFAYDFHALGNIQTGNTVLMAGDNMRFRTDGQFDGANDVYDTNAWTARFQMGQSIMGYPITPAGLATQSPLSLVATEWKEIFKKDDYVLNVHIPAIGPLEPSLCYDSLCEALKFFPLHFPEHCFVAFACVSWLLDFQLQNYLEAASNIVKFQRKFYLFPTPKPDGADIIRRVFGKDLVDIDSTLPTNSLQSAILTHLKQGGVWRTTGGFIFQDGFQYVRSR